MAAFFPAIGAWYQELATGRAFEIIAVDEKNGLIEVQYEDGDIADFDKDSWGHLDQVKVAAPDINGIHGSDVAFKNPYESEFYSDPLEGGDYLGGAVGLDDFF